MAVLQQNVVGSWSGWARAGVKPVDSLLIQWRERLSEACRPVGTSITRICDPNHTTKCDLQDNPNNRYRHQYQQKFVVPNWPNRRICSIADGRLRSAIGQIYLLPVSSWQDSQLAFIEQAGITTLMTEVSTGVFGVDRTSASMIAQKIHFGDQFSRVVQGKFVSTC